MEVNESMIDDPNKQLILRADIPDVGIRKTIRVQLADKCQDILESLGRRLHLENATSEYKLYKIQLNDFRANGENAASSVPMDLEKRLCDYGLDWKDHDLIVVGRIMAPNQPVYGYASAPTSPQMGGTRAISTSRSQQLAVQLQQQLRAHTASSKTADHELENELKDLNVHEKPMRLRRKEFHHDDSVNTMAHLLSGTKKMGTETFQKLGKMAQKVMEPGRGPSFRRGSKSRTASGKLSIDEHHDQLISARLFGAPLESAPVDSVTYIPIIMEKLLTYIELNDMETEGIFRLSGGQSAIQVLKDAFDRSTKGGADIRLDRLMPDGHTVASLVKLYLRELPEPLLTYQLYDCWIAAQSVPNSDIKLKYLHHLIRALPKVNRRLLKRLCEFFYRLAQNGQVNKMTAQNIATVLGPNILFSKDHDATQVVQDASSINALAHDLVVHQAQLFESTASFYRHFPHLEESNFVYFARALYPYKPIYTDLEVNNENNFVELGFEANDIFFVQDIDESCEEGQDGWWLAERIGKFVKDDVQRGVIPSNYIEILWKQADQATSETSLVICQNSIVDQTIDGDHLLTEMSIESVEMSTQTDVVMIISPESWESLCKENAELKLRLEEMQEKLDCYRVPVASEIPSRVESPIPVCRQSSSAPSIALPPPQSPPSPPKSIEVLRQQNRITIFDEPPAVALPSPISPKENDGLSDVPPLSPPPTAPPVIERNIGNSQNAPEKRQTIIPGPLRKQQISFLEELQAKQSKRNSWAPGSFARNKTNVAPIFENEDCESTATSFKENTDVKSNLLRPSNEELMLSPESMEAVFLAVPPPPPAIPVNNVSPVKSRAESMNRFHFPPPPATRPVI